MSNNKKYSGNNGDKPDAPDIQVIPIGSSMTVDRVADLKVNILEGLAQSDTVILLLSRVERIDLAGIHLIYGARREAEKRGKTIGLNGRLNEAVGRSFVTGGFCRTIPHDARELSESLLDFKSSGPKEE